LITHYLGKEEVSGYARDLAKRLSSLGDNFPTIWSPIGHSGDKLLREIAASLPDDLSKKITVIEIFHNKNDSTVSAKNPENFKDTNVLLLDSSVHSGKSMLAAARFIKSNGASIVFSYALVVKKSAGFLPHYFGVVVDDHDRALFQLEEIPNNRLFVKKYEPFGVFRRIEVADAKRSNQCIDTGVKSIDKISLGDLFYEHRVNGFDVLIVEDGEKIAAFLKIKAIPYGGILIDVIANHKDYHGRGVGGALMRYTETLGRSNKCIYIELWSISNMVEWYIKFGFESTGEEIDTGNNEVYCQMRKRLLYHFDLTALND
jgi:GNAT superfamily N-acetyltransferase